MMLTKTELDVLMTDKNVELYCKHGYCVSQVIFTKEKIQAVVQGSERDYHGKRDAGLPDGTQFTG